MTHILIMFGSWADSERHMERRISRAVIVKAAILTRSLGENKEVTLIYSATESQGLLIISNSVPRKLRD